MRAQQAADGIILAPEIIRVESQFTLDNPLPSTSFVDANVASPLTGSGAAGGGVGSGGSGKCNILFDPSEYNVVVVHKAGSLQRLAGSSPLSGAVVRQAVFLRSTSPPPVVLKNHDDGSNAAPTQQQLPGRRKTKRAFVFPH